MVSDDLRAHLRAHLNWAPQGGDRTRFLVLALAGEAGEPGVLATSVLAPLSSHLALQTRCFEQGARNARRAYLRAGFFRGGPAARQRLLRWSSVEEGWYAPGGAQRWPMANGEYPSEHFVKNPKVWVCLERRRRPPGLQNRHYDESHDPCYGHEQKKACDPQGNKT
jgi:hypothetical protein